MGNNLLPVDNLNGSLDYTIQGLNVTSTPPNSEKHILNESTESWRVQQSKRDITKTLITAEDI